MHASQHVILVVEDDPGIGQLINRYLERDGHRVCRVADGRQALAWLEDHHADLMLLDYVLSHMTATDLLDELARRERTLPFIIITGHGCEEVAVEFMKRGALDYITKGTDFSEILSEAVRRALERVSIERRLEETRAALDEKTRFNQVLLDALPCLCLLVDADGGVIASNQFSQQRGLAVGTRLAEAWSDDHSRGVDEVLAKTLGQSHMHTSQLVFHDRHWALQWVPVPGNGALVVGLDVTEQKVAERERHAIEQRLHEIQKIQAVGQLAGSIAHDFNNLLTGMLGYAELLLRRLDDREEDHHFVRMIHRSATQASALTQKVLSFSKQREMMSVEVDLHKLILETRDLLEAGHGRMEIDLQLDAEHHHRMGDPSMWLSSLLNLGINARDAMPEGGSLTICTRNLNDAKGNLLLEIAVHDTGSGMPPEVVDRIFEPFYTTKAMGKGTGLGMTSVLNCVRSHRGAITVDSRPGEGSSFHIRVPVVRQHARRTRAKAPEDRVSTASSPGARVVVIDDEEVARDLAVLMLKDLGYKTHSFPDGPSALDWLAEHHHEVDLVLLDVRMPEMDGPEVYARLKQLCPHPRVLLVTGFSGEVDLDRLIDDGVLGVIDKPYTLNDLRQQVGQALVTSLA